jgi:LysM repeat protein
MHREAKLGLAVFVGTGLVISALFSRSLFGPAPADAQIRDLNSSNASPAPVAPALPVPTTQSNDALLIGDLPINIDTGFDISIDTGLGIDLRGSATGNAPRSTVPTVSAREGRTYVVQSGDKLWTIAEKMYGNGSYYTRIQAANPDVLANGSNLTVGTTLIIPASASPAATGDRTARTVAPTAGQRTHVVKSGELLSTIARDYYGRSSDWQRIVDANPGLNPRNIKVGQQIIIP